MTISTRDLRLKFTDILRLLSDQEEVIVTYRGKPKAKIVPFQKKEVQEDIAFGMWKDQNENVDELVRRIRKGREFDL